MELMFSLSVLAIKASHDRFELLLDDLMFLCPDSLFLFVDSDDLLVFMVVLVDHGQTLLKVILVHLELREVDVYHLHGVFTCRRVVHHMVPVLQNEHVTLLTDLLLLNSNVIVLHSSPEKTPS